MLTTQESDVKVVGRLMIGVTMGLLIFKVKELREMQVGVLENLIQAVMVNNVCIFTHRAAGMISIVPILINLFAAWLSVTEN